jgi:hypothetical protein
MKPIEESVRGGAPYRNLRGQLVDLGRPSSRGVGTMIKVIGGGATLRKAWQQATDTACVTGTPGESSLNGSNSSHPLE